MSIRRDRHAPPAALAYGVAIAVVVAALLFRFSINFWLGPRVPYLQFFPVILVAAWYGGFGPGVVAAVLSALFAHIWFLQPPGLFKVPGLADLHSLSLFVLAGCGIAYLSGQMKRAETSQRQTADQWRTTLASIGEGVIVTDTAGRVTFVNDAAARLTGWDTTFAVNKRLEEIFVTADEESRHALENPVARVLRDGALAALANQTVLKHRDGHWTPIANSGARIRGTTTEVEGVVLVFRDMTAERAAADALRRSQTMLQAISDNSPTVIYAKDINGRYLFINKRYSELFHVSLEDMLGKTDHDLFEKDAADGFRAMDQRVARVGAAITEEESVPQDDGLHTYISVKCPLPDERGQPYAIFGVSTDITERKRSVEALRANEERTRAIVDTALDAVITIDASGRITGWSPQAERTFGWSEQEAIGCLLANTIVPERYREAHRSGLERYLATGEAHVLNQRLELSALDRNRREFPVELAITPIRVGTTTSFSAFVRDISERKRTEQALLESQRQYQALAESLPHLVWTCRSDGYCDYLSRQWVEYTGRPEAEQRGYGWAEQLHPDDRERVQAEWSAAVARGDRFDVEFRIRRFDGVYRWFKTRAVPLHDSSGGVVKWFGSNTDFEDYKRSDERLRAQLERLDLLDRLTRAIGERQDLHSILQVVVRSLEEQLPLDFCCICLYEHADESLTVVRVGLKSQAVARELAMIENARVAIGQNGLSRCVRGQLVYEPDIAADPSPFPQRLAGGGLRSLVAAPLLVESQVFGVLMAARRESGGFTSAECEFLRQLSEHVALAAHQAQLYTALQQAYDDLRQTQQVAMQHERLKALGQMASGIAHDINNAISPVALYTESLLEDEPHLSERGRGYLSIIQRSIEDVAQTVARMREFYRPREPQLVLTPVDLDHLAQDAVELTRARWNDIPQQRGTVITLILAPAGETPAVMGVESEIREALINLIFNAVDAMPEGGTLTVRTGSGQAEAAPSRRAHIEVIDTGSGMDAETRRRCFEPFFTTKGDRGTGLGLARVYGMVQRHGAEIEIESTPGQGTRVRLTFAAPAIQPNPQQDEPRAYARPSRLRILVVDDDPLLLKSLRDTLEGDGHSVSVANGGEAGVEAFHAASADRKPFDVVITDLGMPYVDGRQLASRIKQASPSTPIVLLTGWGQRLVDEGSVSAQVDRVLNKPPKLSELRPALAELTPNRTS